MSTRPDESKIAKLPVWARNYIRDVERERDVCLRQLNAFCESQKQSPIYYEELVCTGEKSGPSTKRAYVQSRRITIEHAGVTLNAYVDKNRLRLRWGAPSHGAGEIAMIPDSYHSASLVSKENMR